MKAMYINFEMSNNNVDAIFFCSPFVLTNGFREKSVASNNFHHLCYTSCTIDYDGLHIY